MDKKVIFDFDGTLIRVNSFPKWVKFLLWNQLKNAEFKTFFKLIKLLFHRKISRRISHNEFKQRLMQMNFESASTAFAKDLMRHLNQDVFERLKFHLKSKDMIAISSAAPLDYLMPFMQSIVQENLLIIGSRISDNELITNHKISKLQNLELQRFIDSDEEFDILYTDSWDDFSLAQRAKHIILVNPTEQNKALYLKNFLVKIEILKET